MVKKCSLCHLPAGLMCSRCLEVYCSFACQIQDWSDHRRICFDIPKLPPADSYLKALTDGGMLPPGNSVATERTSRKSLASIPSFIRSLTPLRKPHFSLGEAVGASVNREAKVLPAADVKREPEGSPSEKTRNITVTMERERRMVTMKVIENAIENLTPPEEFTANKAQISDKLKQEIMLKKHTKADKADKQLRGFNGQVDPEAKSVSRSQQTPNPDNRGGPEGPMNRGQGPPPSPMHIQKILIENAGLIRSIQFLQNMGKGHECISHHEALHRNLLYLANLPDPQHIILALLPPFHVLHNGSSGPLMHGAPPNGIAPGPPPGYEGDPKHGPQAQTPGPNQLAAPTSQAHPPPLNQQPVDNYRGGPQAMPQQYQPYQSQTIYPLYGISNAPHCCPPNAPQSYHHGGMSPNPSGSGPQGGPPMYGPPMGGQYPPQAAGRPPMAHAYPDYGIPKPPNAYSQPPPGYPPIISQPSYIPPQQQYPFNYPVPHGQTNPPASVPSTQTSDASPYANQSSPAPGQTSSSSPSANGPSPSTQYHTEKTMQPPRSYPQSASGGSQVQGPPPGFGPVYPPYGCYQQDYSPIPVPPQGYQYQRPSGGQMPSPGPQGLPPQGAYRYGYEQLRCSYYFSK